MYGFSKILLFRQWAKRNTKSKLLQVCTQLEVKDKGHALGLVGFFDHMHWNRPFQKAAAGRVKAFKPALRNTWNVLTYVMEKNQMKKLSEDCYTVDPRASKHTPGKDRRKIRRARNRRISEAIGGGTGDCLLMIHQDCQLLFLIKLFFPSAKYLNSSVLFEKMKTTNGLIYRWSVVSFYRLLAKTARERSGLVCH